MHIYIYIINPNPQTPNSACSALCRLPCMQPRICSFLMTADGTELCASARLAVHCNCRCCRYLMRP